MKITLASYNFYPENNLVSHRTFELAKEFSRNGHHVIIYIPDYNFDYSRMEKQFNFTVNKIPTGFFFNKNKKHVLSASEESLSAIEEPPSADKETLYQTTKQWQMGRQVVRRMRRLIFDYGNHLLNILLPNGKMWEYSHVLKKALLKENENCDMLISIAAPFPVHIGVAAALKRKPILAKTTIADYGDAFFYDRRTPKTFYFKIIENKALCSFDYITVPSINSVNAYLNYKIKVKIKVIPQGYDFSTVKTADYQPNKIPTFAYAGTFNKEVKNPFLLLEYLSEFRKNFRFLIFLRLQNRDIQHVLKRYKIKLGDKLIIHPPLPRLKCIYEFSKADFLINIDDIVSNQSLCKVIDYELAGRPIFTFNKIFFNKTIFNQFLQGNYTKRLKVDLNNYKIENVCNKFLNLHHEKN